MDYKHQILEIYYSGNHIPVNQLIASSIKYRRDFVYIISQTQPNSQDQ